MMSTGNLRIVRAANDGLDPEDRSPSSVFMPVASGPVSQR
jgi:hypothetical protein